MSELDKFKRRTIRSVARLLLKEKKPPEELWAEMKKETGTDCRVLWERMRALCVKKLNRMLAVDDRSANLPSIARLSLTDWLLVDLVLVHEKIDVIMMDKADSKEYPALIELFNLVQRFDIEGKKGSQLAEAWAAATVFYNRQGRQCSPMLLQRRWHQLKKLTRCRFYKFWQSYRGNARLLAEARKTMPTRLQMAIAKRYPKVITDPFPDWEQLIEMELIIMPEEFEAKMRMPNLPKPCNSNDPDLVLVEPVIETIELAGDSDPEEHEDHMEEFSDPEKSNDATDIINATNEEQIIGNNETLGIKVKTEPAEQDGLSNVQVISATHVPEVEIPDDSPEEEESLNVVPPTQDDIQMDDSLNVYQDDVIEIPSICSTVSNISKPTDNIVATAEVPRAETNVSKSPMDNSPGDDDDVIGIPNIVPTVNIDIELHNNTVETTTAKVPLRKDIASSDVVTLNDSDEFDDIIKIKADEFCRKGIEDVPGENEVSSEIDNLIKDKIETFLKKPKEDISFIDKKPDVSTINLTNKTVEVTAIDLMADLNFIDDGIEFVDDGVEFVEDDDTQKIVSTDKISSDGQSNEDAEENNKFDLKLLMDPVVYTTKLDQMKIFITKQFNSVKSIEDMEMAVIESKPVSKKSFKINIEPESIPSIIDDVGDNDNLFTINEETDEEEVTDEEIEIVSPNSYMLKKPRTRSYDPIKLCKNPDFNTKLRRLTIGFLSSTRNRQLLNACIPLTIDLSKAFESKLVNRTLYLKSSGTTPNRVKQEVINKHASSILPSVMPVQSLIDNSKGDIQNLIFSQQPPVAPIISERQKVINLPDIEKVRRINQQLLTAQVPPLRVYAGNNHKPQPTASAIPNEVEEIKETVAPEVPLPLLRTVPIVPCTATEPVIISTISNTVSNNIVPAAQNTLPIEVKIKSETSIDQKAVLDSAETTPPPETLPPAKEKLLKIINQAKISTQEALVKLDSGTNPDDFPKPIAVKKIKHNIPQELPRKYTNRNPRVSLAWAPRFGNAPQNLDDFLLTDDTLQKMLHLLMNGDKDGKGCSCCREKAKKSQVKKGRKPKALSEETKQKETDNSEPVQDDKNSETTQKDEAPSKTPPSVPINIDDSPPQTTTKKPVVARGRVVRYCCWANQKLCNRKRITRHACLPEQCKCCCRDLLAVKLIEDEEKRKKEINRNLAIELSDDEGASLRKACESIENVVQQSRDTSNINIGQDKAPDGQTVVIRTLSINTALNSPSVSNVSPEKASVDVALSPTRPHPGPIIPTTPSKSPSVITKIVVAPEHITSMMAQRKPEPRFKQAVQPRLAKPSPFVPCSCQKPALSQDSQRYIVIDGSKNCPLHPVPIGPKQEKVLYLHSKSIAKGPSENPIFLGKNKILLTTVKFPRKNEEAARESEVVHSPKIIPSLPLPAGVQLVLMPSGNVTYTLDPGVELDEAQLATLPTIIAAVQEQLNSSGHAAAPIVDSHVDLTGVDLQPVVDPSRPLVNISETDLPQAGVITVAETTESQSENNLTTETSDLSQTRDNIAETAEPLLSLKTNEEFQDTELHTRLTNKEDMETDTTESRNIDASTQAVGTSDTEKVTTPVTEDEASNVTADLENTKTNNVIQTVGSSQTPTVDESGVQNQIETQEIPSLVENVETTQKPNDKEGINNRKTLLSDLMEMSGISAEDATVTEPAVPEPPSVETMQTATNIMINTDQAKNLPELSPVTSFAELKYACEQNGKFFKLDFETGVIVPINVCIKKNPKNQVVPLKTKEFIDLTDDVDVENKHTLTSGQVKDTETIISGHSTLNNPVEYFYNGKTVSVTNVVKPVKLFRAFRPIPTVLKRPTKIKSFESSLMNKQTHIEKRKQTLNKVEAKIDLVDSDEPMEEEYLLDSSDDDSRSGVEPMIVETLDVDTLVDSDDSSDDEPLAKKFKRLQKADADNDDNIKETNIFDEIADVAPQVPEPSELTHSVMRDLGAIDTPLLSHGGEIKDLAPQIQQTSQFINSPVPPVSVRNDLIPSVNVRNDLVPSVNVRNDLVPSVNVRTDLVPGGDGLSDFNEDEESDKETMPELRFMFDQSDEEGEEEDCILGV